MTTWQIVLLCVCAFAGSLIGGFITAYWTGAGIRKWVKKELGRWRNDE